MGKKVIMNNFQSQKISKNNSHNNGNKKNFNKLIKLLKPKVYITESCNFKNLVQQLTGNGSVISSPPLQHQVSQELDFSQEYYKRMESWKLLESDFYYVGDNQEQFVSLYDFDYDLSNLL